jgi:uracil-DNA glycosylase family 4
MLHARSLLFPDRFVTIGASPIGSRGKSGKASRDPARRGCGFCPANKTKGIRKIKGCVRGKKIMVWAQSPGPVENAVRQELKGKSGRWWWHILWKTIKVRRKNCDIQNVVRCFPADWSGNRLRMRDPNKEERFCCSLYTDRAVVASRAKVHVVLGKVAAQELLGKEYSAKNKVFWSDKLRALVVCLDHPSYFVNYGGSKQRLDEFKQGLEAAVAALRRSGRSKFSYLRAQDYRAVSTAAEALALEREIVAVAQKRRVAVDFEDATINGKRRALLLGFCSRPGRARTLVLDHPQAKIAKKDRIVIHQVAKRLVANPRIRKALQNGTHDDRAAREIFGVEMAGYDWDTRYCEYCAFPGHRSYKLGEIALRRFPDFAGYKEIIMPEAAPPGMSYNEAYDTGQLSMANVPLEKLILYNCADCDLTKRAELSQKLVVSKSLAHIYRDAAYIIELMEPNGPLFDAQHCDDLEKIFPRRASIYEKKLQKMANAPEFNPGSPEQVAHFLYQTLGLPVTGNKPDTRKETLETLAIKTRHLAPTLVLKYRSAAKAKGTYLDGLRRSAAAHARRVRTIWWLTGTTTGRLRSGGSGLSRKDSTIVNLQNIHGDLLIKNLLVSSLAWRRMFKAWQRLECAA